MTETRQHRHGAPITKADVLTALALAGYTAERYDTTTVDHRRGDRRIRIVDGMIIAATPSNVWTRTLATLTQRGLDNLIDGE